MEEQIGDNANDILDVLAQRIEESVGQLEACRKENEALQAEIASLQSILRSCKLPVSGGAEGGTEEGFSYAEKVRVRQKLVQILQRIEVELRNDSTG